MSSPSRETDRPVLAPDNDSNKSGVGTCVHKRMSPLSMRFSFLWFSWDQSSLQTLILSSTHSFFFLVSCQGLPVYFLCHSYKECFIISQKW